MAFYIENEAIYLTKGDDAALEVSSIAAEDGSQYSMQAGDVLTLTVRALPSADSPALIQIPCRVSIASCCATRTRRS